MKISFETRGNFNKLNDFIKRMLNHSQYKEIEKLAQTGVDALASATPVDSGLTASSWNYEIHYDGEDVDIIWTNSNMNKGVNIAIILQYGHGTGTGGYVQGRDYINPAIQPVFDEIAEKVWKEVSS